MNFSEQNNSIESRICAKYNNASDALIEILHDIQNALGYIGNDTLQKIAHALNLSRAEVYGVVSFYEDFKTEERTGKLLKICRGEACQSMGANKLLEKGRASAAHAPFDVEAVYCLGNCALGPTAMLENTLLGRLSEEKLIQLMGKNTAKTSKVSGPEK